MTVLSVLDQSPIRSGATPALAVAETLQLAQAADRLAGFGVAGAQQRPRVRLKSRPAPVI